MPPLVSIVTNAYAIFPASTSKSRQMIPLHSRRGTTALYFNHYSINFHSLSPIRFIGYLLFIFGLTVEQIIANPIVGDFERRQSTMVSEKVEVFVGTNRSLVHGIYRFRQERDDQADGKDRHVTLFIPMLLPYSEGGEQYEARHGKPSVAIGRHRFTASLWNDITLSGYPEPVKLPHK